MLAIHIPNSALHCVFYPTILGWNQTNVQISIQKRVFTGWLLTEVNLSQIETFMSVLDPKLTVWLPHTDVSKVYHYYVEFSRRGARPKMAAGRTIADHLGAFSTPRSAREPLVVFWTLHLSSASLSVSELPGSRVVCRSLRV